MTDKIDKQVQITEDQMSVMNSFNSSTDNLLVDEKGVQHFPPDESLRTTTKAGEDVQIIDGENRVVTYSPMQMYGTPDNSLFQHTTLNNTHSNGFVLQADMFSN